MWRATLGEKERLEKMQKMVARSSFKTASFTTRSRSVVKTTIGEAGDQTRDLDHNVLILKVV